MQCNSLRCPALLGEGPEDENEARRVGHLLEQWYPSACGEEGRDARLACVDADDADDSDDVENAEIRSTGVEGTRAVERHGQALLKARKEAR